MCGRAPGRSDQSRALHAMLAAHDRAHSNHVIGIRGMAHPQQESDRYDGEQADHGRLVTSCRRGVAARQRP